MITVQVLETALKVWELTCISIDSPSAGSAAQQPEREEAFILNLQVMHKQPSCRHSAKSAALLSKRIIVYEDV
jgi:Josephin